MGGWGKTDLLCLAIALVGIIAWQITDNPILGLYFSILADFTGMIPALIKTFRFPETEIALFFALDCVAWVLTLLAVEHLSIVSAAYPVYIFGINALMVALVLRPRSGIYGARVQNPALF